MTFLWLLNTIVWGAVMGYMATGAWGASFGRHPRSFDPMRLAFIAMALLMSGFSLRWLVAPDNLTAWKALYILSSAVAVYVIWVARAYGRGGRVD